MEGKGFRVTTSRVTAVGEAFAAQQGTPTSLAGTLSGAGSVDAGFERDVTAKIQTLTGNLVTALNNMAQALEHDAAGLRNLARSYESDETALVGHIREVIARLPEPGQ